MNYNAMDAVKLIMAAAVVAIHVGPLAGCDDEFSLRVYGSFVELAVPFFFLSSGFLLASKMTWPYTGDADQRRIQKYLRHILYLYLIWSLIYLPLAIWDYVTCGDLPLDALRSYMRGLLFVGEHYNSWMLWYLLSTIYSLLMIWALLKQKASMETVLAMSVIVFMISSILDWVSNYSGTDPIICSVDTFLGYTFNNGRVFRGMLYIVIGMYLAHHRPRPITGVFMAVAGFIASCMGAGGIISCIVCSIGILCMTVDLRLPDSPVYGVMRNMSTGVYFVHLWVWTICYMVMFGEKTEGPMMFAMVLSISMAISFAYALLKPHLKPSRLRLAFLGSK